VNDLSPLSDLIADDLLLDRLAGRVDAGSEPVATLLGALAAHADTPLPSRTGRRRIANKHRYLGAFAALAVAASGAGVAAAVTLPTNGPSQADRARIVRKMDESARSDSPSALLARLGLPQTSGTTEAKGLVLARAEDGTIVLLPAAVVVAQGRAAAAGINGMPGAVAGAAGGRPVANGQVGKGQVGNGQVGKGQVGKGQVGNPQGGTAAGGGQTGTPRATNNGKKPAAGTRGGKKATATPTATPTPTPTGTSEVVPQATLATSTPTAPASKTRPTGPVRPRPTGTTGGSSESGSSGTSGTSGSTSDGTSGTGGTSGTSGTEGLTDTLSGTLDGAASTTASVVGALTLPVVPTL
jgi:hypothetical protein